MAVNLCKAYTIMYYFHPMSIIDVNNFKNIYNTKMQQNNQEVLSFEYMLPLGLT